MWKWTSGKNSKWMGTSLGGFATKEDAMQSAVQHVSGKMVTENATLSLLWRALERDGWTVGLEL